MRRPWALFAPAAAPALQAVLLLAGVALGLGSPCANDSCIRCSADGSECLEFKTFVKSVLDSSEPEEPMSCNVTTTRPWANSCAVCKPDDPTYCLQCGNYCNSRGCTGYFVTKSGQCSRCPQGASACDDLTGLVTSCRDGYGLVGGECRPCKIDSCQRCDGDPAFCTQCSTPRPTFMDGFYPDPQTGICKSCDKGCRTCTGPGQCSECTSTVLDPVNKVCLPCDVANCVLCSSSTGQCEGCDDGYFLDEASNSCVPCSVLNCASCPEGPAFCSGCMVGYGLVLGECKLCDTAYQGCASCDDNPALCTSCVNETLSPDPVTGVCSECQAENCQSCTSDDATRCYDFLCAPGFFFNDTTWQCEACGLAECASCNDDPLQCDEAYSSFGCMPKYWWDYPNRICTPCQDPGCEVCDIYEGEKCERCLDGYFLDRDTKQCKQCSEPDGALYGTCKGQIASPPTAR